MHAGEVDIAKKHHWNRVTEAARFEHGRSCGFIATLSRFARNSRACHPWQARSAGKGSIGPFAYAASPLRSRHLCILHIRVRNVESEIDAGIFGVRFVPPPGIIF